MNLSNILSTLRLDQLPSIPDHQNADVKGISHDSRTIQAGEVFVALSGGSFDGHTHIENAISKGAVAVVGEKERSGDMVPYIKVANSRFALAELAAAFYGFPARKMYVIGVTGTDGKTTTVSLIHHILTICGIDTGMVSTVNARIGSEVVDTGFHVTTPEAPMIQHILQKMVDAGMTHVVIEATSHGLEQSRVAACYFDLGVVTNITHEHLDYHGDYDNYLRSKAKLLKGLLHGAAKKVVHTPTAILNHDDISYQPLQDIISTFSQPIQTKIYGTNEEDHLSATNIQNLPDGLAFNLVMEGKQYPVISKLIGEYNVYNILAAISAAYFGCGIDLGTAIRAINSFSGVPGRMEQIDLGQDFQAIVDFAHTPNALKVALETSRNRTKKRVIAVFGSAGLRDREKRRMMAATSIKNADITVITAEDPRTENLDLILSEMKEEAIIHGGIEGKNLFIIPDRGEAIKSAVFLASVGDLVIACGKGHEQSMCFGETEYPWDDRIALRSALASLMDVEGPRMPYLPTQDQ